MVPTLFLKQGIGPVYLGLDQLGGGILVRGIFLTYRIGPEYLGSDQLGGILVIGVMLDTRNSIAIHSRSIEVLLQSFEIRINLVNL